MTAQEIAAHLHVSRNTIHTLVKTNGLPVRYLGHLMVTHKRWIMQWIEAGLAKSGSI